VCTSFLAYTPPTPASSTVFEPPEVSDEDNVEPHIRAKVYMRYALPEESSGISTAHAELTIAKHYVHYIHYNTIISIIAF